LSLPRCYYRGLESHGYSTLRSNGQWRIFTSTGNRALSLRRCGRTNPPSGFSTGLGWIVWSARAHGFQTLPLGRLWRQPITNWLVAAAQSLHQLRRVGCKRRRVARDLRANPLGQPASAVCVRHLLSVWRPVIGRAGRDNPGFCLELSFAACPCFPRQDAHIAPRAPTTYAIENGWARKSS
jgi:hypothetical protein